MKFTDLQFGPHGSFPSSGIAARQFFQNGYGVSVVRFTTPFGSGSYGADMGLYELAVLKGTEDDWNICYDTHITEDVLGYQTEEQIESVLNQIEKL